MSIILFRNNLGNINRTFCGGSLLRLKLSSRSSAVFVKERQTPLRLTNSLLKHQIFNPCWSVIRGGTTAITIKQYESSRKYTGLWKAERFAGISLIFLIPLVFCFKSKELEMTLGFIATLHTYWGCQSMCNDYVRSSVVGKFLPVLARILNVAITLGTLVGFYQLIYNDCGIADMIKKFWSIQNDKNADA